MAKLTNSVSDGTDTYLFEDMNGSFVQDQEHLEIIVRPGIPGQTLRQIGTRGDPIRFKTLGYVLTFAAAKVAELSYQALNEGVSVTIVHRSVSYGKFHVLRVQQVSMQAVENVVGGIVPNTKVRQICEWLVVSE